VLTELLIKNFVLIDELRLELKKGFVCFTGETGAGKSILVDALSLLSGGRADTDLIRSGEIEAIVEGVFEIPQNESPSPQPSPLKGEGVKSLLEEQGFSLNDDPLIIRRLISTQGKSRIFINGQNATLAQLERIGSSLIDLAGQHDQQSLLKTESHRDFLDSSLDIQKLLAEYCATYVVYQEGLAEIEDLRRKLAQKNQRGEFLKFQIDELEKAKLSDPSEEDNLIAEKGRAKNAALFGALAGLASDDSSLRNLDILIAQVHKLTEFDSRLGNVSTLLEESKINLTEAIQVIGDICEEIDIQPGRLEEIESRLYQIFQLKKKYGVNLAEVMAYFDKVKEEMATLDQGDDLLQQKEADIKSLSSKLLKQAITLSEVRKKRAKVIEKEVEKELKELGMSGAKFRWDINSHADINHCGLYGIDQVHFEIAPNPGEGFKSLSQIASGGELSRVLLALKVTLTDSGPTRLFDEIDAGIGGETGLVIGKKLKRLSESGQVLCVTHLPQVATHSDQHFVISKSVEQKRTRTRVVEVENEKRVEEVARMLGGVSATALDHARGMLTIVSSP